MLREVSRALGIKAAAVYVGSSPRTLADARWRQRVGLPATRIGRRLVFLVRDLDALLSRGRERTPRSRNLRDVGL